MGSFLNEGQERGEVASQNNHPGGNFSIVDTETKKPKTLEQYGYTSREEPPKKINFSIKDTNTKKQYHGH